MSTKKSHADFCHILRINHGYASISLLDTSSCWPPTSGSQVRVLVTPCGFCGGRIKVWVGFSRGFSRFLSFILYLPSPSVGLTPPGIYKPNVRGSDACRGSNRLWSRTLDKHNSGPPSMCARHKIRATAEITQDRTQTKDTCTIPGEKLKFLTPPGIELGPPGWKAGTLPSTPRLRISRFPLLQISFHHFLPLISLISFHVVVRQA